MARMRLSDKAAKAGSTYVAGSNMATIMKWKTLRRVSTSHIDDKRSTTARPTIMIASQYPHSIRRVFACPNDACLICSIQPRWHDFSCSVPLCGGRQIHLWRLANTTSILNLGMSPNRYPRAHPTGSFPASANHCTYSLIPTKIMSATHM